jgi:hypothetical protein
MLPNDCSDFLSFVQQRDPVVITNFSAGSADVQPFDRGKVRTEGKDMLCLWNLTLLPSLEREYIEASTYAPYYRIDSSLPILEFTMPTQSVWDERPALTQGRIYACAYQSQPTLRVWFEALARWIRKNFTKNPVPWMSGYVGPEAYQWYKSGGLLLPCLPPPENPEWRTRIYAQHPDKNGCP